MHGVHWISNYNDIIQGQYFESNIETSLKIMYILNFGQYF